MTDVRTFLSQPLSRLVAVCALPVVLVPLLHWLAVARFGSQLFLWLQLFIMLPILAAPFGLLIAPFFVFVRHSRPFAIRVFIASAVFAVAAVTGIVLGNRIRMAAFGRLADRSAPLIKAILAYESRHGTPPPDLRALVPEFISAIPATGMAAYPRYEYYSGESASGFDGNPWVVFVPTPSGGLNWDQFMYFPLQNYPQTGYGGSLERISHWAYVHE